MSNNIRFKAKKNITKGDIIRLCCLLNKRKQYQNVCEIEPEEICGGGLKFKFCHSDAAAYYKSVNLNIAWGKWGWVKHAMARADWQQEKCKDILFKEGEIRSFTFIARSGAPAFTEGERFFWDECLHFIGFVRASARAIAITPVPAGKARSFKNTKYCK